jgi:hypothetical protein
VDVDVDVDDEEEVDDAAKVDEDVGDEVKNAGCSDAR